VSYFNGEASHWLASSPADDVNPVPLPRDKQDLVIVGGGLTGLWSAYYARQAHPDWAITVIEATPHRLRRLGPQRRLAVDPAARQPQ
jgi:monoamine oxidase